MTHKGAKDFDEIQGNRLATGGRQIRVSIGLELPIILDGLNFSFKNRELLNKPYRFVHR